MTDMTFELVEDDAQAARRNRELFDAGFPIVPQSEFKAWARSIAEEQERIVRSKLPNEEKLRLFALIPHPWRKRST